MDSLRGTKEAGKDELDSLRGTREVGKSHLDNLGGTREAGKDQLDRLRGTREKTHLIYALPTTKPAELKLLPLFVHKCEELNNQITASIFWKKNAPQKDKHRY